jgi:organic radical activating enzyme
MMGILDVKETEDLVNRLFLWDAIEKRGTPITNDIYVVDIDMLSHEQRLVITGGDPEEIQKLVDEFGSTLESQLTLSIRIFAKLVNTIYDKASPAQQGQIMDLIRNTLKDIEEEE